jgi:hypothetical protein
MTTIPSANLKSERHFIVTEISPKKTEEEIYYDLVAHNLTVMSFLKLDYDYVKKYYDLGAIVLRNKLYRIAIVMVNKKTS